VGQLTTHTKTNVVVAVGWIVVVAIGRTHVLSIVVERTAAQHPPDMPGNPTAQWAAIEVFRNTAVRASISFTATR
jgi:hypothetical protein